MLSSNLGNFQSLVLQVFFFCPIFSLLSFWNFNDTYFRLILSERSLRLHLCCQSLKKKQNSVSYWIISIDLSSGSSGSLTFPSVSILLLNLSSRFFYPVDRGVSIFVSIYLLKFPVLIHCEHIFFHFFEDSYNDNCFKVLVSYFHIQFSSGFFVFWFFAINILFS